MASSLASLTTAPSSDVKSSTESQKPTVICVFCGAAKGKSPKHAEAARELGKVMAENNISLVYGGGTVGLMGEVAKTVVAFSGPSAVHGIIPEALVSYEREKDWGQDSNGHHIPEEQVYGRTTVVKDMHTRKQMMAREVVDGGPGSGFIALSGGYGTMEELLETATWNQLGIHNRGVCILNIDNFYSGLLHWLEMAVDEEFIKQADAGILVQATDAMGAIQALQDYKVSHDRLQLAWNQQ